MARNIFNSVKGMHPMRNKFTADTYRNDFTAPLGVNIPCFWAELPPATRFKVSASALVRLQALISPVMDNIDYYVHFWKVPYRLLENDRFTQFITGEIEPEDYDALFAAPANLSDEAWAFMEDHEIDDWFETQQEKVDFFNSLFGNGSIFDFLGYDSSLFGHASYNADDDEYIVEGGNYSTVVNWRGLIVYYMIHLNWYMNENVEYFDDFADLVDTLVKQQSIVALAELVVRTHHMSGMWFLPHAWDKDYFTSALPNVQFGDPVSLSLASSAPVTIPAFVEGSRQDLAIADPRLHTDPGYTIDEEYVRVDEGVSSSGLLLQVEREGISGSAAAGKLQGGLGYSLKGSADLTEATAITINELRFANALQIFKERQMRFGRRRLEYYKGFFDVEPEDLRLQVPKYLGGGRIPINISDIEQTSATDANGALGHLAGKATAVAGGFAGFSTFCSEETYIIGIAFAMPHITYAQQLSRFKLKTNDRFDYFNASFEHLGEQAIKNIEIFAGSDNPDGDFGYTPRFTEYRFHSNEMHGEFKGSLSFWSLGRIFDSQPALNADFIYMQPKVFNRIFAVADQPNMIVSMLFHTRAIKPVSKYGTPMLLA